MNFFGSNVINDSIMNYSKVQLLDYLQENKIYFPIEYEKLLLEWNSLPLINLDYNYLEISLGVFIYFMKYQLGNQIYSGQTPDQQQLNNGLNSIDPKKYKECCREYFTEQSFQCFPNNFNISKLQQQIKECFTFHNYCSNEKILIESSQYIRRNPRKDTDLRYSIFLYRNLEQPYNIYLIYSTRNSYIYLDHKKQQKSSLQIDINNQRFYHNNISINNSIPKSRLSMQFIKSTQNSGQNNFLTSPQQQENFKNYQTINQSTPLQLNTNNQLNNQIQTIQINNRSKTYGLQQNIFTTVEIYQAQVQSNDQSQLWKQQQLSIIKIKQESYICDVCEQKYEFNSCILTPCCKKKVHSECYRLDLIEKANKVTSFEKITCYCCEKSLDNHQDFLKQNFSNSQFNELIKRKVKVNILLKCCHCQLPIQQQQEQNNKQIKIQCQQCKTSLCNLCGQEYHGENTINQQCPIQHTEIKNILKNLGQPCLICPFCNLPQTKDDKCNHVECYGCKRQLCSACSVDKVPIMAHGNHYHRIGCSEYREWEINGKVISTPEFDTKNCSRCKESNQACQYPISLEEYKKLKNF